MTACQNHRRGLDCGRKSPSCPKLSAHQLWNGKRGNEKVMSARLAIFDSHIDGND